MPRKGLGLITIKHEGVKPLKTQSNRSTSSKKEGKMKATRIKLSFNGQGVEVVRYGQTARGTKVRLPGTAVVSYNREGRVDALALTAAIKGDNAPSA